MRILLGLLVLFVQSFYMQMNPSVLMPEIMPDELLPKWEEKQALRQQALEDYGSPAFLDAEEVKRTLSYQGTSKAHTVDEYVRAKEFLENYTPSYSIRIACLGDSITYGANSSGTMGVTYPDTLAGYFTNAEVLNYGIAGSSLSTVGDNPMVKRYTDIPEDVDVIILLGGANDSFFGTRSQFGADSLLDEGTFLGDADILIKGIKKQYPDALLIVCTPLDTYKSDEVVLTYPDMVPLREYAEGLLRVAASNEVPVIDLYHSGILNTYDPEVTAQFCLDGVHPNDLGYTYLGTYIAAQVVRILEENGY